jgi:hypothetical protein
MKDNKQDFIEKKWVWQLPIIISIKDMATVVVVGSIHHTLVMKAVEVKVVVDQVLLELQAQLYQV